MWNRQSLLQNGQQLNFRGDVKVTERIIVEIGIGSIILAHPDPDVTIHGCHLLKVEKITREQVIAVPIDGPDGFMIVPVGDIRACGEEEIFRKEEHERTGNGAEQSSKDYW